MTDRGKTFSAPMVRALLEGRKTQTRRLLNPQPSDYQCASNPPATGNVKKHDKPYFDRYHKGPFWCWWDEYDRQGPDWIRVPDAPGDRLYVREHWKTTPAYDDLAPRDMGGEEPLFYLADGVTFNWAEADGDVVGRHRQAMHMPRWASRLTLLVTDVRVQRLQDISEADCIAEGIEQVGRHGGEPLWKNYSDGPTAAFVCPIKSYRLLWNSLHSAPGTRWEDNPWIYAVTFDVRHGNIDQIGGSND